MGASVKALQAGGKARQAGGKDKWAGTKDLDAGGNYPAWWRNVCRQGTSLSTNLYCLPTCIVCSVVPLKIHYGGYSRECF